MLLCKVFQILSINLRRYDSTVFTSLDSLENGEKHEQPARLACTFFSHDNVDFAPT